MEKCAIEVLAFHTVQYRQRQSWMMYIESALDLTEDTRFGYLRCQNVKLGRSCNDAQYLPSEGL